MEKIKKFFWDSENNQKRTKNFVFLFLIALFTIYIFKDIAFNKGISLYMDTAPYNINIHNISDFANYTWNEHYAGIGTSAIRSLTDYFLLSKIYALLSLAISSRNLLNTLWVILPYIFFNCSLFIFFLKYTKKSFLSLLLTATFISTFIYRLFLIASGSSILTWSLAGGLWLFYFFDSFLSEDNNVRLKYFFLIGGGISSILALANIAYMYTFAIAIIVYIIAKFIIAKSNTRSKIVSKAAVFGFNVVVFNLFWLLPVRTMLSGQNLGYVNSYDSLLSGASTCASYITNFMLGYCNFAKPLAIAVPSILLFLIFVYATFVRSTNDRDVFPWMLVFMSIFPITLGLNFWGWKFVEKLPGNTFLRFPQRFYFIVILSMLVSVGIYISKSKSKPSKIVLYLALILIPIIGIQTNLLKNNQLSIFQRQSVPSDYDDVNNITSKNPNDRVLILPSMWWLPSYSWETPKQTSSPVVDFYVHNRLFLSFLSGDSVPEVTKDLFSDNFYLNNPNPLKVLGFFNIKYVLYQKDISDILDNKKLTPSFGTFEPVIQDETIYNGKNLSLYKVPENYYLEQFYLPEKILYFKNKSEIYNTVANSRDKKIALLPNDKKLENIQVNNTNIGPVKKNNPTSYTLNINNARNNSLVIFSEVYSSGWNALAGKKTLPHLEANGYANAWLIKTDNLCLNNNACTRNSDGTYNIKLSVNYVGQKYYLIGLLTTSLYLCLLTYFILIREVRKND